LLFFVQFKTKWSKIGFDTPLTVKLVWLLTANSYDVFDEGLSMKDVAARA